MDHQSDSGHTSEGDTFDDAQEMTPRPPSSNARPLIDRVSSSSVATQPLSSDETPDGPETSPADQDTVGGDGANADTAPQVTSLQSSAQRISMSAMDDVNLAEGEGASPEQAHTSVPTSPRVASPRVVSPTIAAPSHPAPAEANPAERPPILRPTSDLLAHGPAPTPPSRKISSPFAWLSRSKPDERKAHSPSFEPTPRTGNKRDTASSVATISSNPELMLNRFEGGEDGTPATDARGSRNSLRDRFKFLRMREEAGITSWGDDVVPKDQTGGGALAGLIGRSTGLGLGIGTPTSLSAEEKSDSPASAAVRDAPSPAPLSPTKAPTVSTVNMNLAPGTASGLSAGPAGDEAPPVDWDLWQSVVYEGPQAVARTSPEELNRAIASGIPHAIRGVVWQVLAQSKNDDLEGVYRELAVRGTDKDRPTIAVPHPSHPPHLASAVNGSKEKESIASSASSTHSGYSTPATAATGTTHVAGSPPPAHDGQSAETLARVHAKLTDEHQRKAKDDAAALQRLEKAIKRDLGARTSYSKYVMAAGLQDGLFGVCKAYALFDEAVGYAQGMNFIAMPLLFNMPEEEAFCLLVRLMNQYHLRDLFVQDMPGLHLHLYQFERLLEDFEPALYCHLSRRGVHPPLYATQWFLTLFAYRFPLQLVLRIYDLILSEGLEGAILKFGIVLMRKNAPALLGMHDMSALTTFLKERLFDVYIDKAPSASSLLESGFFGSTSGIDKEVYRADTLVQDACAIKITPAMLTTYAAEWREKRQAEREREAEMDGLRQHHAHLTAKVRSLEERAETSDIEHVHVASELVRTKVENEALRDANESLLGQVAELKTIVEAQPHEVEQRLRSEMDTVMARNIEVYNANRTLEDQMAEMEKDLVETKMQYAEIHTEYETLKQRWNSVSAMLQGQ